MIFPFAFRFDTKISLDSKLIEDSRLVIEEKIKNRFKSEEVSSFYEYNSKTHFENYPFFNQQPKHHFLYVVGSGYFEIIPEISTIRFYFSILRLFVFMLILGIIAFIVTKTFLDSLKVFMFFYLTNLSISYFRLNSFKNDLVKEIENLKTKTS